MPIPVNDPTLMWICRVCERMAAVSDLGGDHCNESDCGSPLVGKAFPMYKGPFSGMRLRYCFKCGSNIDVHVLSVAQNGRVGICDVCWRKISE